MKASIRSVALIGVLALVLASCDTGTGDPGNDSTTTTPADIRTTTASENNSTTTTTPTTSTSTRTPLCSADGLVAADEQPQGDLPAEVAAMRMELLEAATSCDFDRLGALATANSTAYTFGGGFDPGGYWRDAEENGQKPLADLVRLLNLEPVLYDVGEGNVFYVWPAVYALPDWSDATEQQRQELADLFGADQLAGWDSFGGYVGYRVGITTDGRWTFFVAGD